MIGYTSMQNAGIDYHSYIFPFQYVANLHLPYVYYYFQEGGIRTKGKENTFNLVMNTKYSRLTGFDALLIDRMVYYKFRVIL